MTRLRVILSAILLALGATAASAETLLMPPRPYLAGTSEVVWGITTLANGTPFVLDYGDGAQQTGNVTDRSYIAFNHTYALANTYTVTLCVGAGAVVPGCLGEQATVQVQVYNAAVQSPENLRNININRTIQNGFRYLWVSQANRTTFDTTSQTNWGGYVAPFTSMIVLAFENHGYKVPNDNSTPVGIYPKYVVRRGLNYVLSLLNTQVIANTPAGDNPCVGLAVNPCNALYASQYGDPGYENAVAILAVAGSGALSRVNTEVANAQVVNQTYGEILQRLTNATTWGQNDSGNGRGGWNYGFNSTISDGSTVGWDLLALFDAAAAGMNVPVWVKNEWAATALPRAINTSGSFDYNADNNPASEYIPNVAKTGVGLQGMVYAGRPASDQDVLDSLAWLGPRWNGAALSQEYPCQNGTFNKGCAYGMFNVYKGLKLYGIVTLAGVNRLAGPGAIPADDWYADYVDWLVANQTNPTTTAGGFWTLLGFSSQYSHDPVEAGIAELILAPVALIAPDPDRFSAVGLQHGTPLSTNPDTNPTQTPHMVTAKAESGGANPAPIAGVLLAFQITGRNAAVAGTCNPANCVTGGNGIVTYSYTDAGAAATPGTDNIRAFVGQVGGTPASNILVKNWVVATAARCDANGDGSVTIADLTIINTARGQNASSGTDPRDGNGDGKIDIADVRYCQLRLTPQ